MIDQLETIKEGDLQTLEQSVLKASLSLGRTMLEQILTHAAQEAERPSKREGECGHRQRLVGLRSKQLHTLMGKVTIARAYSQCVVEKGEQSTACLAQRCGVDRAQEVVILGDGARWIRRLAEEHFPHATQIVDLYHAREHVWNVANAVYGSGTADGAAWAKQADDLLTHGQIEELVQLLEQLPAIPAQSGAARSLPEIEADYFLSNAERMRYPIFRAKGMHLGSGIAEAACKTVVSTRAKRSGMRWTPQGLDAVLALRTCVLNHSYDSFWEQSQPLLAA
jgi:hypothetical protein